MAYFTPEDIRQAKQLDLLTYLQIYEPDQLIKVSGDTYCTKEHDSLKISNLDSGYDPPCPGQMHGQQALCSNESVFCLLSAYG